MVLTTSSLKQLGCLPAKEALPFNLLNTPGAAVLPWVRCWPWLLPCDRAGVNVLGPGTELYSYHC